MIDPFFYGNYKTKEFKQLNATLLCVGGMLMCLYYDYKMDSANSKVILDAQNSIRN